MHSERFDVVVKQSWTASYFNEKGEKVEYENSNEIKGKFYDWEQVEAFTNNVLSGFEGAIVEIKIVRED